MCWHAPAVAKWLADRAAEACSTTKDGFEGHQEPEKQNPPRRRRGRPTKVEQAARRTAKEGKRA
jgi:hypothetical protein